ncbi:MAG: DUF975 family protein [Oscillospiraceae bacterium]|nr:DUF975 family protein [Oscillospiraceae bacterium]
MWSISMLKENAKRMLSGYYWVALAASLIVMILTGGFLSQYKSEEIDLNEALMNSDITSGDYDFSTEEGINDYFNDIQDEIEASDGSGTDTGAVLDQFESIFGDIDSMDVEQIVASIVIAVLVIVLLSMLFTFLYSLLFANPLIVGHNRFYLDARMGGAQVGNIFSQFGSGKYGNTVKTMFIYDLKLWLWGLLGLIPFAIFCASIVNTVSGAGDMDANDYDAVMALGMEILGSLVLACLAYALFMIPQFIKRLSYTLVPYILSENPQMPQKRAFEISVQTMKGEKAHFFGLQMSFIGWFILASLAGSLVGNILGTSIGSIVSMAALAFLYPYIYATYAEFYCCMREKAMATGIASSDELNGTFGKAAQGVPFPESDPANTMPYQRVDTPSGASGSYPAYPQNGSQPAEAPKGGMEEIPSDAPVGKIELEKKDGSNDDYSGPEIK